MQIREIDQTKFFDAIPSALTPWFPDDKPMWFILDYISEAIAKIYENNAGQYEEIKKNVYVGKTTIRNISGYAEIKGPALIGNGCELRHGAFLRENVIIGDNCVIGNSTEIKNSVLFNNVEVCHFNYIGDSILCNYVHFGAGAIISNVLLTKNKKERIEQNNDTIKPVKIKTKDDWIDTGRRKFGAIIGDYAEIGINATINPGTLLEMNMFVPSSFSIGGYFSIGYIFPRNIIYNSDSKSPSA